MRDSSCAAVSCTGTWENNSIEKLQGSSRPKKTERLMQLQDFARKRKLLTIVDQEATNSRRRPMGRSSWIGLMAILMLCPPSSSALQGLSLVLSGPRIAQSRDRSASIPTQLTAATSPDYMQDVFRQLDKKIEIEKPREAKPSMMSAEEGASADNADDGEARQRAAARARAALLAQRSGGRASASPKASSKSTSIGARRVGSTTKARQGAGASSKLADALRKTALGTTRSTNEDARDESSDDDDPFRKTMKVSQGVIYTAIEEIMRHRGAPSLQPMPELQLTAAYSTVPPLPPPARTIGVLGETVAQRGSLFRPGSIVLPKHPEEEISIRLATPQDDVDVASLRLSVFSDFSAELQNQFCARSCQAISNRRMRGAVCIVATMPIRNAATGARSQMIVGSAEISFHEFFGTLLGRRRPRSTVLYVTEVAVNPSARRRGIGAKLLAAIDVLANARETETLYLHVDVNNKGAIALYKKAGYRQIRSNDRMYKEFTRSLNLHPGATKGREHHLFYKHLTQPTWLRDRGPVDRRTELIGSLGFEIPA